VLNGDARMLDDISRAALKVPEQALRSLLGCFLFSGDDVFKPLGVLSGGERNRYALARILVSPSNFLLLDEPTNHLDMRAKDVLLEAIAAFSARSSLSRTTAISSIGWLRACSKWKVEQSKATKAITRTICGAKRDCIQRPVGRRASKRSGSAGDEDRCDPRDCRR